MSQRLLVAFGAEPMVMGGRTMKGYIRIKTGLDARSVKSWLRIARSFVEPFQAPTLISSSSLKATNNLNPCWREEQVLEQQWKQKNGSGT